jgi:DNA-binding transcriptional LysR family regulator
VVVAYGGSASYETAPRLLRALAERHPEIAMSTAVRSVDEVMVGLSDGSIDLGLVRCPPRMPQLDVRAIRMEPQGLLVRRDHPWPPGRPSGWRSWPTRRCCSILAR